MIVLYVCRDECQVFVTGADEGAGRQASSALQLPGLAAQAARAGAQRHHEAGMSTSPHCHAQLRM